MKPKLDQFVRLAMTEWQRPGEGWGIPQSFHIDRRNNVYTAYNVKCTFNDKQVKGCTVEVKGTTEIITVKDEEAFFKSMNDILLDAS